MGSGPEPTDADVVIVGGGPAGSVLACLVAAGGHKAIVVERMTHPREHVGELLTPSTNAVLHRIGLLQDVDAAGFVRRNDIGWSRPGARGGGVLTIRVSDHPAPRALRRYGFNVDRSAFDALLVSRARALGAEVQERTAARRVEFQDGRAVGVEVQRPGGATEVLRGRFVVDASGRRCLLGTQLNLLDRVLPGQCAMYAWFRGVAPTPRIRAPGTVVHMLGRRRSWAWQIPLSDGVTSVGVVLPCDRVKGSRAGRDELFATMIEESPALRRVMEDAHRIGPWRLVSDYSYQLRRAHGPGWLLVGDASGFIDPIFASGVDVAMHSAVFAYEAILPLLLLRRWSDTDEDYALSRYEHRLRQGTAVWSRAVELFYRFPCRLERLARQRPALPAICRFLQGNPYEVQNELLARRLFAEVGGET